MSEMPTLPTEFTRERARNSGLAPFRSLRVLIAPAYPGKLIVSLVVLPKNGHPHLHDRLRQLEASWFPEQQQDDLAVYAAKIGLLQVAQTGL